MARVMMWLNYRRGPSLSVPSPADGDPSVPWWYDHAASLAPTMQAAGVTDVLLPQPCKTNAGSFRGADGYGVFDPYDIGSKSTKQFGDKYDGVPTRFGTAEQLRRCIAVYRANGINVHIDHVMHQLQGGRDGVYRYASSTGGTNGRFPKDPPCFRGAPPRVPEDPVPSPPDDFSFGDQLCPVNAQPKGYVWDGLIDAGDWLFRTLGVQGARLDDMKGINVGFMVAFMTAKAMKGKFFFGEYASGNRNDTVWWVGQVQGLASAIDFDWHYNMAQPMCNGAGAGTFRMAGLAGRGMIAVEPLRAMPFVESMDSDTNGFATIVDNKILAYALLLGGEGLPLLYIRDFLREPDCYGLRDRMGNLSWIAHQIASGPTVVREGDDKTFVFERTGGPGLLVCLNNDVWNPVWPIVTVQTAFGPNVELKDYSGQNETHYWTDAQGRVKLWIPPGADGKGYGFWSRVGLDRDIEVHGADCVQEFFGAADLDIAPLRNGPADVARIWCENGTPITIALTPDAEGWGNLAEASVSVTSPKGAKLATAPYDTQGQATQRVSTMAAGTGWHTLSVEGLNLPTEGSAFALAATYRASRDLQPSQF